MVEQQQVVGIFLIATNKYWQFLYVLINSIENFFLKDCKIIIHLFSDEELLALTPKRIEVKQYKIESYKFPYATLLRYKIFIENVKLTNEDYIFYLDVDMECASIIGSEILNEVTVVSHPGFYINKGWGSPNVDVRSTAYIEPERRKEYVCGGFNGGSRKEFMKICNILKHHIEIDEDNKVMAEWHDESHLNKLISTMEDRSKLKILPPSYCMPEQELLRTAWSINNLPIKIIALEKKHSDIRS